MEERNIDILVADGRVSGVLWRPQNAKALYVLAHGAGAGMQHEFMVRFAGLFAEHHVATMRYQFPYMEKGSKRTDPASLAMATVRCAIAAAKKEAPDLPLFVGGKSFGGRMTSQALSEVDEPDVKGIVFLGFPLHPPKKEATVRAEHLGSVRRPMFFVQGTRDSLANMDLMQGVWTHLGSRAGFFIVDGADHGFQVLKRSGQTQAEADLSMVKAVTTWMWTRT